MEAQSGRRPNEQPRRRRTSRTNRAVRAGGTSATDRPVVVIANPSNITEVANGNPGRWTVRRLPWISRARELNTQYPGHAQQNADTLNREFLRLARATATEVTTVLALSTMG